MRNGYSQTFSESHFSTMATFLVESPYIDSCLKLSIMATFFCPKGGHCGEVQWWFRFLSESQVQLLRI